MNGNKRKRNFIDKESTNCDDFSKRQYYQFRLFLLPNKKDINLFSPQTTSPSYVVQRNAPAPPYRSFAVPGILTGILFIHNVHMHSSLLSNFHLNSLSINSPEFLLDQDVRPDNLQLDSSYSCSQHILQNLFTF